MGNRFQGKKVEKKKKKEKGKKEKLKLGLSWVNEFIAYFSCVEMFLFCFVTETQENDQNVNLQS